MVLAVPPLAAAAPLPPSDSGCAILLLGRGTDLDCVAGYLDDGEFIVACSGSREIGGFSCVANATAHAFIEQWTQPWAGSGRLDVEMVTDGHPSPVGICSWAWSAPGPNLAGMVGLPFGIDPSCWAGTFIEGGPCVTVRATVAIEAAGAPVGGHASIRFGQARQMCWEGLA
jgi:hypothetical protein